MKNANYISGFIYILIFLSCISSVFSQNQVNGQIGLKVKAPIESIKKINNTAVIGEDWFDKIAQKYYISEITPIFHVNDPKMKRYYRVKFDPSIYSQSVISDFLEQDEVENAWIPSYGTYDAVPSDPYFDKQWALRKIKANDIWTIESGNNSVIIGIVDSGIDLGDPNIQGNAIHPDLESNLWNDNGTYGYRVQSPGELPIDGYGHGTHVAGIVGAVTNNYIGVAGIAGGGYNGDTGVRIMTVMIDDGYGNFTDIDAAAGIVWAADPDGNPLTDDGADVINMSFSFNKTALWCNENPDIVPWSHLQLAIEYAYNCGAVLVSGMGNSGREFGYSRCLNPYPAYYDEVISVCSVDSNDVKAGYSNYAEWTDVSAPGGYGGEVADEDDIYSTTPRYEVGLSTVPGWAETYGYYAGTSMATPYVSGLAGLLLSYEPSIPSEVVKNIIKQSSDDIGLENYGTDWSGKLGAGRINASSAICLLQSSPSTPVGLTGLNSGGHPRICWNKNPEADVKEYKVKRILYNWTGLPFKWETLTSYFTTTDTFYQDNSFSIGSDKDKVYYSVCAVDYCDNSSNYTSSVIFQGTAPLWKANQVEEKDTVIYCISELDGIVYTYNFAWDEYWSFISGKYLLVGDDESHYTGVHYKYRSYVSFDLSFLPSDCQINKAFLKIYQKESWGNTVINQYPVLLINGDTTYCSTDHVSYGDTLSGIHWFAGDAGNVYTLESNIGYISTSADTGFKILDVTQYVADDLLNNRKYSQYRFYFPLSADQDDEMDLLYFCSSDYEDSYYHPRLEISYTNTNNVFNNSSPYSFSLLQNYPNPFNSTTTIFYELPEPSFVTLSVFDIRGKLIITLVNEYQLAGYKSVIWEPKDISSGIYIYKIDSGKYSRVKKCLLVK